MSERTKYRVKPGFTFGKDRGLGPGDIVELTAEEAGGFLDKLEAAADDAELNMTGDLTRLPDSILAKLTAAGYTTDYEIIQASDDDLLSINGIGEKALESIRETVTGF